MREVIPFFSFEQQHQAIRAEVFQALEDTWNSRWYVLGEKLRQFEREYAAFSQVAHCIGVGNGLDALTIALRTLEVGKGDEVILPANTFIATALAVTAVGARPVLADPDPIFYNLNAEGLEKAHSPRTKAIIPVHLYGQPCPMDELCHLAQQRQWWVIEDNAQAQGASLHGKPTGSWGHINATSFYPTKNLGALGDGGALTTQSAEWAEQARALRNYGSHQKYEHLVQGVNSRLDEVQAAVLSVKLKQLKHWNQQRQQVAGWYQERLREVSQLQLPAVMPGATHVYHLYVIRTERRDELKEYLRQKGVETALHYPVPIHLQPAYRELGYRKGDFPITERLAETCLSLPMYPGLTESEVDYIAAQIRQFQE